MEKQSQRPNKQQIRQIARERFGYESLRAGQEAAIKALLDGHDTLAVMPTGSGKSAIYQIAGILIPGPTVVISPLIALQRDQVESIAQQDVGEAAVVNSTVPTAERQEVFEALEEEELEFLFLAPEQFNNPETLERLQNSKPSLFVVDEAHCISEWGHDFRPDYLRLGSAIAALGHPRILALTATAAPTVREEIIERLGMHDPQVIVQGFDRPNIWLGVKRFEDKAEKEQALLKWAVRAKKPGIVYVATRKKAEEVEQVAAVVHEQDEPIKRRDLREQTGLSQAKVATALNRLEEVGVVEMLPTGEVVESEQPPEVSEAAQEAIRAQERYQHYLRSASLVP